MILYTHAEHSPTKTIYIKYYIEKQTHTLHVHPPTHKQTNKQTHKMTVAEIGYCWGENTVRRGTQQQRPEWLTVTLT